MSELFNDKYECEDEYEYDYQSIESIEEEPPKRRLHLAEAQQRLSVLSKTESYNSYAYVKISATNMNLTNIKVILKFKYLLFVDVSDNKLKIQDLQILTDMKYLLLIQCDRNLLRSAALHEMEYLQVLLFNENMITTCEGLNQPLLNTLELRRNKITDIHFDYPLPQLRIIDLSYNQIESIGGLEFTSLEVLYLAGNHIKDLTGIQALVNLKILHLRGNPIQELGNFGNDLTKLIYINFRSCAIDMIEEFKKLKVLSALQVLIIKDCPIMEGKEEDEMSLLRSEVVAIVKTVTRINKDEITEEERTVANDLRRTWEEEEAMEENDD